MPPRARKAAAAKKVDETVVNQENPGTSEEDRGSTDTTEAAPEVAKAAPANEVDVTVVNQESLGAGEVVDRNPDPQIVESFTGATYDVSKSHPELIDPDAEENEARRNRLRQTEAAMNAKDLVEEDEDEGKDSDAKKVEIEFVESGLTAQGRVWKVGEVLSFTETKESRKAEADINDNVWYELSADEQKDRYGKVFFEKR